ncbi:MAG: toprim domain-containing protein [Ilumatobacteraceae bacterium]
MRRFDRDDVLAHTDLRALLDEITGPARGSGAGARWHCPVPDHDDVHPSVTVTVDRRGVERWRCWSLGHGGTAIDVLYHARDLTFRDAVDYLADRAGISGEPARTILRRATSPRTAVPLQREATEYVDACRRLLWEPAGRQVLDYLRGRGLDDDVLRTNGVGADPGPGKLRRGSGLPKQGPGAVFPAHDIDGRLVYFQARYLQPRPNGPKYANPSGRHGDNPHHGWTRPVGPARQPVVISEGLPDAYVANAAGYDAIAVLGTANANERLVERLRPAIANRSVILAFDGDDAGRHAAAHLAALLSERGNMVVTLPLPSGTDLNSWVQAARSVPDLGSQRPRAVSRPSTAPVAPPMP